MVKDLLGLSLSTRLQSWCSTFCAYMGMTRRPALENNVAKPLELPYECPHSGFKCSVIGNISELAKHLKDDHNVPESMTRRPALENNVAKPLELPYECPHSGFKCSVIGNISELAKHLKDDHNVPESDPFSSPPRDGYEFDHNLKQSRSGDLQNPPGMYAVFNCYGQRFCYHVEYFLFGIAPCYIVFLRFMGEETEAKKFRYSLQISKNGRNLTWQGVPSSIRDSHHKVCDIQDGLVIPRKLVLLFSDESEQELKLRLEGRLWKT
ncbi:Seven-in-absentia protein, sina [Artemisia annua]|uniref:Seven-in-absentia protein, sina n=1 Tax=Artemisia annua TaxID=35608 RepID=A0A2U1NE37_ARTAN|nr:Seven-in-absentia protein, sina [Artemisia annua]